MEGKERLCPSVFLGNRPPHLSSAEISVMAARKNGVNNGGKQCVISGFHYAGGC